MDVSLPSNAKENRQVEAFLEAAPNQLAVVVALLQDDAGECPDSMDRGLSSRGAGASTRISIPPSKAAKVKVLSVDDGTVYQMLRQGIVLGGQKLS